MRGDIKGIQGDIKEIKKVQAEHTDLFENRVIPSITETEITIKSYADSYKLNKHNIERLATKLSTVEENLNIEPEEELKVPHLSN